MTKSDNIQYFRQLLKQKENEIKKLTKENNELRTLIDFNIEKFEFINRHREEAIIKYIKNNPGTTRLGLIKKLANEHNENNNKGYGTSKTLNKSIDRLVEENIIRVEQINIQKHSLFLNDNNALLKIKMDLIQLKDNFYHLISIVVESKNKDDITTEFENYILPHILINIYYQTLNSYFIQILLKWSNEFKTDNTTINKINHIIFYDLFEISFEFRKKFNFPNMLREKAYSVNDVSSPLLRKIIENSFILKPNLLIEYIKHYKRLNLHKEFLSLVDIVWEISFPLFRYLSLNDPWITFPISDKELIMKHFSLLVLFCLNETDKYVNFNGFKKEKSTLFDFRFTSEQEKKAVKEIIIDYIKNNSIMTNKYRKLKEYELVD